MHFSLLAAKCALTDVVTWQEISINLQLQSLRERKFQCAFAPRSKNFKSTFKLRLTQLIFFTSEAQKFLFQRRLSDFHEFCLRK